MIHALLVLLSQAQEVLEAEEKEQAAELKRLQESLDGKLEAALAESKAAKEELLQVRLRV